MLNTIKHMRLLTIVLNAKLKYIYSRGINYLNYVGMLIPSQNRLVFQSYQIKILTVYKELNDFRPESIGVKRMSNYFCHMKIYSNSFTVTSTTR